MATKIKISTERVRNRPPSSSRSISTADEPRTFSPASAPSRSPTTVTSSSYSSSEELEPEEEPLPAPRRSRKGIHVVTDAPPERRDRSRVSRRDVQAPELPPVRQPSRNSPRSYQGHQDERERERYHRHYSDEHRNQRRRAPSDYSDDMGPHDDRYRQPYPPRYGPQQQQQQWGYQPQPGYDPTYGLNPMVPSPSQMVPFQPFPQPPFYPQNPLGSPWAQPNPLSPPMGHMGGMPGPGMGSMGNMGGSYFEPQRAPPPSVSMVPYPQYYPYPVPTQVPVQNPAPAPAPAPAAAPAKAADPPPKNDVKNNELQELKGLIMRHEHEALRREQQREQAFFQEKEAARLKAAAEAAAKREKEALEVARKLGMAEAEEAAALLAKLELEKHEKEVAEAKEAEGKAKAAEKKAKEETAKLKPTDDALKAPLKFKDAIGRKFTFPWRVCKTWKGMDELIQQAFLHVDGVGKLVQAGRYDLLGPNGEIILPQVWESTVEPDWQINMILWAVEEKRPEHPAVVGEVPSKPHKKSSRETRGIFASSRKRSTRSKSRPRVVEVPAAPPPAPHRSAAVPPPPPPAPAPPPAASPEVIVVEEFLPPPPAVYAAPPPEVVHVLEHAPSSSSAPKKSRSKNQPQVSPFATWMLGGIGVKGSRK